jgi:integrase
MPPRVKSSGVSSQSKQRRPVGSITERYGNLIVGLYVGTDAAGKRVYWRHTVHGTDARARAMARAALKQLVRRRESTGQVITQSRQSFGEWTKEFVDVWCGDLSERTKHDLRYGLAHYVPRDLQAVALRALATGHLQAWVNAMTGRGLAPRTVAKALAEVRWCLRVAVEQRRVASNVADGVTPPKRAHVERVRLTSGQAAAFLTAAESDTLYAYFVLALVTGARPSELLGLKWADVEDGSLVIRRSITNGVHRTRVASDTKTGRVRQIPLGPRETEALARHRRAQVARRLKLGETYIDEGYIFAGPSGRPLDAASITHRHFAKLLTAAGLPHMRLYDLRHSCASLLADAGTDPKVIQSRLGHASISTTYDHYVHPHPDGQACATATLNRAVSGR